MKAAVLINVGKPLEILENIQIPALKKGQVLVKVHYAGVCHSQLMEMEGLRGENPYLPHLLGHEGTGEVIEIGEGVTKIQPGDEVVMGWIKGEGLEADCPKYHTQSGRVINAGAVTTFNEFAVVSENRLVKKPKDTPMDLAVLYGCAIPTGAGILLNHIKKEDSNNKTIAFIGLGGIGLSALLLAKEYSFKSIFAVDVSLHKLKLAKKLGATHCINASEVDPIETILSSTDGRGVDFSIEAAGLCKTIEQAYVVVRKQGGQCIFASHPPAGSKIHLDPHDLICGKKIEGTWGGKSVPDKDIPYFNDLYKKRHLNLDIFSSDCFKLEDINKALQSLKNKELIRAIIKFDV